LIDLLTAIQSKLSNVTTKAYLEEAPSNTVFPYITYKLTSSNSPYENNLEEFILEIDVWDNQSDTTALETLATNIDIELQRSMKIQGNANVRFYRVSRLMIPDTDETIRRRQLRYWLKTYISN
jgi:hypothetical protein